MPSSSAGVRVALLGAANWGQRYIDTIRAMPGVSLVALASRKPESARLVPASCRVYADWREAVRAPDVDAVIVATPPFVHAEMALAAVEAGRPVLVEKPLTLSSPEALRLQQEATQRNVLVMVGHTQLFNCAFRGLKQHAPSLGRIRRVRVDSGNWGPFRSGVRALWDYAPHDVSMCLDLVGRAPREIGATLEAREPAGSDFAERYLLRLDFSDVTAEIRTGNGVRPKCRRMEVEGENGTLIFDDLATAKLARRAGSQETALSYPAEMPLATQVREFIEAAASGLTRHESLALGCQVVEILARCDALTAP